MCIPRERAVDLLVSYNIPGFFLTIRCYPCFNTGEGRGGGVFDRVCLSLVSSTLRILIPAFFIFIHRLDRRGLQFETGKKQVKNSVTGERVT